MSKKTSLDDKIAAAETARNRLVSDIDVMDREVRLEALSQMETIAWKAVAGIAAATAGIAATKVLKTLWGATLGDSDIPLDPSDPDVSTRDAVIWTGLTGLGVGVAVVLAQRGAAKGWRKATGTVPPTFAKR